MIFLSDTNKYLSLFYIKTVNKLWKLFRDEDGHEKEKYNEIWINEKLNMDLDHGSIIPYVE